MLKLRHKTINTVQWLFAEQYKSPQEAKASYCSPVLELKQRRQL